MAKVFIQSFKESYNIILLFVRFKIGNGIIGTRNNIRPRWNEMVIF